MGISGKYCKTSPRRTSPCITNVSMDANLPHFWFDVVAEPHKSSSLTLKDKGEEVTRALVEAFSDRRRDLLRLGEHV